MIIVSALWHTPRFPLHDALPISHFKIDPQTKGKPPWGQPFGSHRRRYGQPSGTHRTLQWGGGQQSQSYTRETETSGRIPTYRLTGAAQDSLSVRGGEYLFVRPCHQGAHSEDLPSSAHYIS